MNDMQRETIGHGETLNSGLNIARKLINPNMNRDV
jgi:hypothetical protein